MTVNMLSGIIAVPIVMRLQRQAGSVRVWVSALLALDALVFLGMRSAPSLSALFALRMLDGALHLPAITLLMVAANRMAGPRRGGSLGLLGIQSHDRRRHRVTARRPAGRSLAAARVRRRRGDLRVAALISLGISLPRDEQTRHRKSSLRMEHADPAGVGSAHVRVHGSIRDRRVREHVHAVSRRCASCERLAAWNADGAVSGAVRAALLAGRTVWQVGLAGIARW